MRINKDYPKALYNNENVTVTVQNEKEEDKLKDFFNGKWDPTKPLDEISYEVACRCLGDVETETAQEKSVREENEANEKKKAEALKLEEEKAEALARIREENKKAFQGVVKKLDSYSWNDLRGLGKEIEEKLGVELPLGAKRDVIEKAITEVLGDDNNS